MSLVELQLDGTIMFNWNSLPDEIKNNTKLRDKLFLELQQKYPVDQYINNQLIFEANQYVINRLRQELKLLVKDKK